MDTVDQYIARVKKGLNVHTDDTNLRNPYVYHTLKDVRSELIRQESNKNYLWDGSNGQLLSQFILEESSISESPEYTAALKVYRSTCELPKLTDTKFGKIIHGVYFDNGIALEPVEYREYEGTKKRRYKLPAAGYFFIRNNRLIVLDYDGGTEISLNVEGIYDDPEEVELLNSGDCDQSTYIGDLPFNIPAYLVRRVVELTIITIAKEKNFPIDSRNDSREAQQPLQQTR